eukprot:6468065-Amphidinium_carterae.1
METGNGHNNKRHHRIIFNKDDLWIAGNLTMIESHPVTTAEMNPRGCFSVPIAPSPDTKLLRDHYVSWWVWSWNFIAFHCHPEVPAQTALSFGWAWRLRLHASQTHVKVACMMPSTHSRLLFDSKVIICQRGCHSSVKPSIAMISEANCKQAGAV